MDKRKQIAIELSGVNVMVTSNNILTKEMLFDRLWPADKEKYFKRADKIIKELDN